MTLDPTLRARLNQLLADYGAKVRALIEGHGLGQYGIDSADIEQEVRIRLWKALERDRSAAFHTSYIQRVVLSAVIDAIRAARSRPTEPLPEAEGEGAEVLLTMAAGPEQTAAGTQDFARVAACLAELPLRRREAVALHLQGFSLREIGEFGGTSEEAARKLLDRGMQMLRARLALMGLGELHD
jgi:RNA polymerase sigma-70 factor (ECF subfamily)